MRTARSPARSRSESSRRSSGSTFETVGSFSRGPMATTLTTSSCGYSATMRLNCCSNRPRLISGTWHAVAGQVPEISRGRFEQQFSRIVAEYPQLEVVSVVAIGPREKEPTVSKVEPDERRELSDRLRAGDLAVRIHLNVAES